MTPGATRSESSNIRAPVVLSIVGLGVFITALDQTVVVTALPSVMLDLKIPFSRLDQVTWVVTAYLLGYTVAMPLVGRLADVYGYSLVYRFALVVFCLGSALVAVATNLEWMVAARVLQAVGGGATVPIGMAIAASALPIHRRGWALGVVGAAAEAGSMLGPAYGGAIVEFWNWRGIFWLNLPQSAVVFLALTWLPGRVSLESARGDDKVDYAGGALLIATLTVLSLGLSRGSLFALSSPLPIALVLLGLGLAAVLVMVERRREQPLLPPALFRSRAFIATNGVQLLVGVSLIIAMVTIPLMAGTVMGKTPIAGAFWLLRLTAAIPAGAIIGGLVLRRFGGRSVIVAGLCLIAVGLWLVSGWDLGVKDPELTWNLALAGFGFGLVIAPLTAKALESASEEYRSTAAALVVVSRMMGMTLGLTALSAWGVDQFQILTAQLQLPLPVPGEGTEVFLSRVSDYQEGLNQAGLALFHKFLRVAAAVAIAALLPALAMGGDNRGGGRPVAR
ncbi:MAG: hypothetical protein BZY80_00590 [SAR202 cluster bacterium Io17-Chloro-G2]|nr:MAG: hypothetical protein BZY80_00590 [SAR202 cluster bacterium Io17-Chloro-G2]